MRRRARWLRRAAREWLLDCGDGVRLQAFYSDPGGGERVSASRIAVLLHGWEGHADAGYVLSLAALLYAQGYGVVRLNLRDHGATHHLNREIFHSCRLPEVVGALRAIAERVGDAPLFLAGFSLGGNFLLRAAADPGSPERVRGVVAISPVLDPDVTLTSLERGWRVYRDYFIHHWSASLRRKQRVWKNADDFSAILRLADLRAMTAGLVETHTDFDSMEAYLAGYAITGPRLAGLRFPARILLAEDDPMIPMAQLAQLAPSRHLQVLRTRHGGHCGFVERLGEPSFADHFVAQQFAQFA